MRSIFTLVAIAGVLVCVPQREILATQIRCAGVLGNSGEQGKTLVRFDDTPALGLGAVSDETGSIWDRAGEHVLNRYARDGRLLASYRLPEGNPQDHSGFRDRMTRVGNLLVLMLNGKIFTLPTSAAPNSEPEAQNVSATLMSFNSLDGSILLGASGDKGANFTISVYNPSSHQTSLLMDAEVPGARDIAWTPDHGLLATADNKLHWYRGGKEVLEGWPRSSPGDRLQTFDGYWFGAAGHGTLRRFNAEQEPDPGVVLGGGSGSFIGHVDCNTELENPRGMSKLTNDLFAVSGFKGILHLIQWDKDKAQFSIVRRIGAVPICESLGLNRQGQVLFYTGHWNWKDDPCTPLRECSGGPGFAKGEIGQVVVLPNDTFVVPTHRYGMPTIMSGPFSWNVRLTDLFSEPPTAEEKAQPRFFKGSAVYVDSEKRQVLLTIDAAGKGQSYRMNDLGGRTKPSATPVTLNTTSPAKEWTSLALKDKDTLLGAADGNVIQMTRYGDNWQETRRWKSWKSATPVSFGNRIYISADDGNLWVSDTEHHRVLCFDLATENLRASFGVTDKAGDTLTLLNGPQVIAAREKRAVVFDSGNQRLIKLTLSE